jgi:tetratricopeptide (TPR) repeat protein
MYNRRQLQRGLVPLILVIMAAVVTAQSATDLEAADELIEEERPEAAIDMLESLLSGSQGAQRAEVLWRLSSATLMLGDQRDDAGAGDDELLSIYEEGESHGEAAIEADPTNARGYYWTSANIGRWGQTKGVLNSLFRAPDMRDLLIEAVTRDPQYADSYYVLGQLYAQVPGMISFGNVEYAVSLGRKSVDLMEAELESGERDEINEAFYIQLASHLIDRDWNSRRRSRGIPAIRDSYQSASTPIERGYYYEGAAQIPDTDDAGEAEEILRDSIRRLEDVSDPTPSDTRRLNEARELLDSL